MLLSIATGFGLPRQVAALTAGALFSFTVGFIIAWLAATTGCLLTYYIANYGLYGWVNKRYPDKTQAIHNFLSQQTFVKALVIRILPLGSNFITNIVAGATKTPLVPFTLGTAVGFIPQMILFTLIGSGVVLASNSSTLLAIALTVIALVLIIWLYRKSKTKNADL